ncbi:unnamed protein product [Owenia fusiformis]|uniref:Uncharacterized protein n=1 Tax=Owenia fusiformis TaxID=6347 RepID=A0A8J1T5Y0_OWEFU|nr:unnamed protein product [Owenia fusiformis]
MLVYNIEKQLIEEPGIDEPYISPGIEEPYIPKPDIEEAYIQKSDIEEPYFPKPGIEVPYIPKSDIEEAYIQKYIQKSDFEEPYFPKPGIEVPYIQKPGIEEPYIHRPDIEEPYIQMPYIREPYIEDIVLYDQSTMTCEAVISECPVLLQAWSTPPLSLDPSSIIYSCGSIRDRLSCLEETRVPRQRSPPVCTDKELNSNFERLSLLALNHSRTCIETSVVLGMYL